MADSPSSRILLISPTGEVPLPSLCQLASSITGEPLSDDAANTSSLSSDAPQQQAHTIPWTIDNRYYTADVHFRAVSLEGGVIDASVPSRRHAIANTDSTRRTAANLDHLHKELEEVQAVVIVITSGGSSTTSGSQHVHPKSLDQHRALLDCLNAAGNSQAQETSSVDGDGDGDGDDDGSSMPLGFGLGVSTVVALPSVVASTSQQLSPAEPAAPKKEDLDGLYAENGWEYIDLGRSLGLDADMDGGSDSEEDEADDDDEEEDGLARIREALEANLWPDLVRKRTPAQSGHSRLAEEEASSPTFQPASLSQVGPDSAQRQGTTTRGEPNPGADADAEIEAMFRKLDLNLPSSVNAAAAASGPRGSAFPPAHADLDAQPTPQDEALARKFLASIAAFESSSEAERGPGKPRAASDSGDAQTLGTALSSGSDSTTLPETDEERKRNQAAALRRLEDFLRSEDPDWPSVGPGTDVELAFAANGSSSSSVVQPETRAAADSGFDDDFADFVSPPSAGQSADAPIATGWLPPDQEEVLASSVFKKKLGDHEDDAAVPSTSSSAGDQADVSAATAGDGADASSSSLSSSERQSRALVEQMFARQGQGQGVHAGNAGGSELASTLDTLREQDALDFGFDSDFDLTAGDFNRSTFANLNEHIDDLEVGLQPHPDLDSNLDYPRMLSTIQREAQRVRGIANPEEREREAGKVVEEVMRTGGSGAS